MKNFKITAVIEGKSGKMYLSEKVETMKKGMKRIVDIESEVKIDEPYRSYFIDENNNVITFNQYTSDMQPTDNEKQQWAYFSVSSTGNPLPDYA